MYILPVIPIYPNQFQSQSKNHYKLKTQVAGKQEIQKLKPKWKFSSLRRKKKKEQNLRERTSSKWNRSDLSKFFFFFFLRKFKLHTSTFILFWNQDLCFLIFNFKICSPSICEFKTTLDLQLI